MLPKKCCVDSCLSAANRPQDKGVTFHKLPKNPLRLKWLKQARLNPDYIKGKWNFICSRHFRKTDFEHFKASQFVLRVGAIPTIFPWGSTALDELNKIFPGSVSTPSSSGSNSDKLPVVIVKREPPAESVANPAEPKSASKSDEDRISSNIKKEKPSKEGSSKNEGDGTTKIPPRILRVSKKSVSNDDSQKSSSVVIKNTEDLVTRVKTPLRTPDVKNIDSKVNEDLKKAKSTVENIENAIKIGTKDTDNMSAASEDLFDKECESSNAEDKETSVASEGETTLNDSLDDNTESETSEPAIDTKPKVTDKSNQPKASESPVNFDKATSSPSLIKKSIIKSKACPMLKALIEKPSESPIIKPGSWSAKNSPSASSNDSLKFSSNATTSDKGMLVQGARVEAKDFSEQWYPAKVVEVDQDDMEVLIHYDNWSQRYDEWISMSSPRLRILEASPIVSSSASLTYEAGERCLARWSDNRRFPATVRKVLANGKYEVVFDDGFVRTLKQPMISKARPASDIPSTATILPVPYGARKATPALPAAPLEPTPPPIHNHLFDPSRDHLGSKEERRHMKRKLNVKELFSGQKKVMKKERGWKKVKETRMKVSKIKQEIIIKTEPIQSPSPVNVEPELEPEFAPATATSEVPDESALLGGEWSCRWMNGRPVGTVLPLSKPGGGTNGPPRLERMAVQVADKRLPPGWTKHMTRRCVGSSAGKWDVVLVCPSGRRFRSRVEMRARLAEADKDDLVPYTQCLLDFSVHRKLARRLGWDRSEQNSNLTPKQEVIQKIKQELTSEEEIPKPKTPVEDAMEQPMSPAPEAVIETLAPILPALEDGFVYVGSLKVQIIENLLRCPKEGCFKNFRKDNLLQMHIKHYHRELQKFLGDTPNVADLAYARTIVEDIASPKNRASTGEPKEPKIKEKKTPSTSLGSPKVDIDVKSIKQEILTDRAKTLSPLMQESRNDTSPVRPAINNLDELESSPKLRNALLDSVKPDPLTPKLPVSKIKQEVLKFKDEVKNVVSPDNVVMAESSSTPTIKVERDSSKSAEVKSSNKLKLSLSKKTKEPKNRPNLIMKISGLGDKNRARSQSPSVKVSTEIKSELIDNKGAFQLNLSTVSVPTLKSKKLLKKRHSDGGDIQIKKKKLGHSRIDIWDAFTADHDETRSSFGIPEQSSSERSTISYQPEPKPAVKMEQEVIKEEIVQPPPVFSDTGEKIKIVHMKREEIINCHCGFGEEDGLMIQCDLCLCWQHAMCHNIEKESQVPDKYICTICLHPTRARHSQRHLHLQEWLYEGRLPRAQPSARGGTPKTSMPALAPGDAPRSALLRRSHELSANLIQLQDLLHSLRCKIEVSEKKDHPKLYLWAKPWEDNSLITDEMNKSKSTKLEMKREMKLKDDEESQGSTTQDEDLEIEEGQIIPDHTTDDMTIDEVKMEDIEVSEIHGDITEELDDIPKCESEIELMVSDMQCGEEQIVTTHKDMENGLVDQEGKHVHKEDKEEQGVPSSAILANLLASPGGTPIDLPITTSELETLAKSVQEPPKAPQPEAAIDPAECRLRLLQHVERTQLLLDARLNSIDAQIAELESLDPSLEDDETAASYPRTKQTIQMLLRDLRTMEELGMIC